MFMHESIIHTHTLPSPTCIAHNNAIIIARLLRNTRPPTTPFCVCYTLYNIGNAYRVKTKFGAEAPIRPLALAPPIHFALDSPTAATNLAQGRSAAPATPPHMPACPPPIAMYALTLFQNQKLMLDVVPYPSSGAVMRRCSSAVPPASSPPALPTRHARSAGCIVCAPRWGRRPQRQSGGGGPAPEAATRGAASTPPLSI